MGQILYRTLVPSKKTASLSAEMASVAGTLEIDPWYMLPMEEVQEDISLPKQPGQTEADKVIIISFGNVESRQTITDIVEAKDAVFIGRTHFCTTYLGIW